MHQTIEINPDAAAHLEVLPDHMAAHVGEMAVRLSHEAMYNRAGPHNDIDFESIVAAPQDDSDQLALDAYEAAQHGQQKVAEVLLLGSKTLAAAHKKLETDGISFGAVDLETDAARTARELAERETIYEAACFEAVGSAIAAKEAGDPETVGTTLESLVLLRSFRQQSKKHYGNAPDGHRADLRVAVQAGLGEELLAATQASEKLFIGTGYQTVSESMSDAKTLLSCVIGANLDYNFTPSNYFGHDYITDRETARDVLAVAAMPAAKLPAGQLLDVLGDRSDYIRAFKQYVSPDAKPGDPGSPQYLYALFGRQAEWENIRQVMSCTDPTLLFDAMEQFGLKQSTAVGMFARKVDPEQYMMEPYAIDAQVISDMQALQAAYPNHFVQITGRYFDFGDRYAPNAAGNLGYQPLELMKSIDALVQTGFDTPEMLKFATRAADGEVFAQTTSLIAMACHGTGIAPSELPELIKKANTELGTFWEEARTNPELLPKRLLDTQCMAEVHDAYGEYMQALPSLLPEKLSELPKFDVDRLALLRSRVTGVGVPDELAQEMVKSWATYSQLRKHIKYQRETKPGEAVELNDSTIQSIIEEQQKAFVAQVEALETFTEQYGTATTKGVIAEFGIYSFSRHTPQKLAGQYEHWMQGEPVKSVVVESRSDWNAYTGKMTVFEEEIGDGVFYFEANSGLEVARIAVLIGRRERKQGRDPDVARFIIHAHANGSGLLMGVNGESIDVQDYQVAADGAQKIKVREINDYRRHLGEHFEVLLQGCSTAASNGEQKNIAETMNDRHNTKVTGSTTAIWGLIVHADGSVSFENNEPDHQQIRYD